MPATDPAQPPATEPAPFRSEQSATTGWLGAGVFAVGHLVLPWVPGMRALLPSPAERALLVLLAVFAAMAAWEILVAKVHHRHFDLDRPRDLDPAAWGRVRRRTAALALSLGLVTLAYWLFPFYGWGAPPGPSAGHGQYQGYLRLFALLAVLGLVAAPPYFAFCERFRRWSDDEDELLQVWEGYAALARRRRPAPAFAKAWRSFGVKAFFLPLMLVSVPPFVANADQAFLDLVTAGGSWLDRPNLTLLYRGLSYEIFALDVTIATIGYAVSMRLLDNHVRSADPYALGWLAALACYPPFNVVTQDAYLGPAVQETPWQALTADHPVAHALLAAAIIAAGLLYVWSTIAFGLRFSNLTHRGVLDHGPYRYIRHPAYLGKNLAWWLMALPFAAGPGAALRMAGWFAIYVLRALTEERHLQQFEDYRAYMRKVRYRFIPGLI